MDITRFQKRVENFTCDNCGTENVGNGYTNHCKQCLCSKHVDIFPGDRKEDCGGIMTVSAITKKGESYVIEHICQKCKQTNGDHVRPEDNFDAVIQLVKATNERLSKK